MTGGTVLVLLAAWVALEAWRDWPGPVHLAARIRDRRRAARWQQTAARKPAAAELDAPKVRRAIRSRRNR